MQHEQPVDTAARPNWQRWLASLANAPEMEGRHWRVLGCVGLTAFFAVYNVALLQLALPQIQASLQIPTAELGNWAALIRLGPLLAFLIMLAADAWGRRRLLLGSMVAFSLLGGATAFAPSAEVFALLQFLLRTFVAAGSLLVAVIIIEEFPERARGWGVGACTALASVGGGSAAMAFALVNVLPFGWRTLFLAGLLGLPFAIWLYRVLPETTRFQQHRQFRSGNMVRQVIQPLQRLVMAYPQRFVVMGLVIVLINLGGDPALFYDPTYLQQAHGWQPWQVSLLNLGAGFMAPVGSAVAGRLSDHWGRKPTTILFLAAFPIAAIGYYSVSGWLLPVFWAGLLFATIGAGVTLSTLSHELFPTSYRSTAAGAMSVVGTVVGALSLVLHSRLIGLTGSPWMAVSLLAGLLFLAPLLVTRLPETNGRTLEEISPEREWMGRG